MQRLTIYLLNDVGDLDDALADDVGVVHEHDLEPSSGLKGRFYSRSTPANEPSWARFVKPAIAGTIQGLRTASSSGLLLLQTGGNTFALTFGYGRSFLNQEKIERRFGLKVALNLIDDRQIRSLDTKAFAEMVVTRNTQTSRTSDLPTFGVDVFRDILRAVTGIAPPTSGFKSVTGSDALVIGTERPVTDLPGLLATLYAYYTDTSYQATFGWVDRLSEVKDPVLMQALDEQLVRALRDEDTTNTHLAMPENLEWGDIEHFLIVPTVRQATFHELDLDVYLSLAPTKAASLTLEDLKRRKIGVKFIRNEEADYRWNIYQCLVSEQRYKNVLYALIEGRWFAIADSLVAEVDAAVAALPISTVELPAGRIGESEGDYNLRAANGSDSLVLLDKKLLAPEGASTRIEFCDLMAADGSLVHVKRKTRSSTLSHLFAQGHVSAEALIDDAMRDRVRDALLAASAGADAAEWLSHVAPAGATFERGQITVSYAVIANSSAAGVEWLPFFSRLTLMQTVRDLNRMGFSKVALARVPVEA